MLYRRVYWHHYVAGPKAGGDDFWVLRVGVMVDDRGDMGSGLEGFMGTM